jgi:hypothetical protein
VALLISGAAAILLFQNCSPMATSDTAASKGTLESGTGAPAAPLTGGTTNPGGGTAKVFQAVVTGVPTSRDFAGNYTISFEIQPGYDTENLVGMRYYALINIPAGIAGPGDISKERWFIYQPNSVPLWAELTRQPSGIWLIAGAVTEPFSESLESLKAQGKSSDWKQTFILTAADLSANYRGMIFHSAYGTSINDFLVRKSYSQGVVVPK